MQTFLGERIGRLEATTFDDEDGWPVRTSSGVEGITVEMGECSSFAMRTEAWAVLNAAEARQLAENLNRLADEHERGIAA